MSGDSLSCGTFADIYALTKGDETQTIVRQTHSFVSIQIPFASLMSIDCKKSSALCQTVETTNVHYCRRKDRNGRCEYSPPLFAPGHSEANSGDDNIRKSKTRFGVGLLYHINTSCLYKPTNGISFATHPFLSSIGITTATFDNISQSIFVPM